MNRARDRRGQSVMEYAIMLAAITVVIVATQVYFKRAVQGRWKQSADQIGEPFTTGQNYAIETQQQVSRTEESGTSTEINANSWTRSEVLASRPANIDVGKIGAKLTTDAGAEITKTDYVTATAGSNAVGTHGTFDSGKLSDIGLFQDDD